MVFPLALKDLAILTVVPLALKDFDGRAGEPDVVVVGPVELEFSAG